MDLQGLWQYALNYCREGGSDLDYWRNLPKPAEIEECYFFSELTWCIYNAGMKETVIRQKWSNIQELYFNFNADMVVSESEFIRFAAPGIFNHKLKTEAVIKSAKMIVNDRPINKKLGSMSEVEALTYFKTYPFIGDVTKYHIARNVGFDVVKPDRHLVRITEFLNYEAPDKLVREIANITGERKGFIDYVLWQWLSWQGHNAYDVAMSYCDINVTG